MSFIARALFLLMSVGILLHGGLQFSITVDFLMHQEEITLTKCINKDKPEMECNGRCHLKKQLEVIEQPATEDISEENENELNTSWIFLPFTQEINYYRAQDFENNIAPNYNYSMNPKEPYSELHLPPPDFV